MIEEILPAAVIAVEAFDDLPGAMLFPSEQDVVAKAVEQRRREFATVRACARAALGRLGLPPAPILPGLRGAPQWPAGVVGSMTHCAGYRAAAVAPADEVVTLGLDAEPNCALPVGVLDVVASARERAQLPGPAAAPEVHWDRLLFSAKESVYKAWFPLTLDRLGFEDAAITIDPDRGTFTASLLVPGPVLNGHQLAGFSGRWLACDGLVLTAIAMLAGAAPVTPSCRAEDPAASRRGG
jgi:4'-phosphopantetheinyl transferase EntD